MITRIIFFAGLALAAVGILSPPIALVAGIALGLIFTNPYLDLSRVLAKFLLQASVVALGFGMDLGAVLRAGRTGFVYTAITLIAALGLGHLIGRVLRVGNKSAFLISAGTVSCSG